MDKEKINVLNKLFENGYNTDKEIIEFNFEKLSELGCTKENEILTLIELKRAIKEKKLLQYLSEGIPVKEN